MTGIIEKKNILLGAYGFKGKYCNGVIEKHLRPEAGRYTKLVGCDYLFPGDPRMHILNTVGSSKQLFPFLATILSDKMLLIGIGLLFIFRRKFLWKIFNRLLDVVYASIYELRLRPEKYATPIREIVRVTEIIIKDFPKEMERGLVMLKDISAMNLEYDLAYRWPLQDIIPMIDKVKFNEDPIKEIKRVSDIFQERGGIEDDWRRFEKIIIIGMRFSKVFKKTITKFVNELDFDIIKLTEADWFFCLNRPNYNFKGISYKKRFKMRNEIWEREGKPMIISNKDVEEET